ncbi:precorrin-6A reductase [Mitsuokella jalaludinii]|uniref:precorrin-6A reductase n=1 Tax=Mitsuokella jalaludinii TaxID=187979 RepID=UPI0022DF02EC|nr:precorrin-6A reductase [Mitsuokella jalaludinii]
MIFVAAGTQDGRELTKLLLQRGFSVTASVVSRYGEQLLAACSSDHLTINDRPLDREGLEAYLRAHPVSCFVDASHPYAVHVSEYAMAACHALGIPYLRYERSLTELAGKAEIILVHSYEEAAKQAARCGRTVFLTTGSRNLRQFTESPALSDCTLIARVLPTAEVIALCEGLGLSPKQIVAMQGPFSQALNREMFRQYRADVVVTKNSGAIGGTDTKIAAAVELGLPVVVIDRPVLAYDRLVHCYEDVLSFVNNLED